MDPRTLQLIQRGLVAAVTVVLALVVVIAFARVLQSSEPSAATTTTPPTTTTQPEETTTTSAAPSEPTSTTSGAVIPAVCADEEPTENNVTVLRLFFPCGTNPLASGQVWVYRAVAPTDLVLTTTMKEMVNGLDEEEIALGYRSPFPDTAPGSFLGATIDRDQAKAFLEFTADVFPDGVDTPEGAQVFLSTLNANTFQFSTINQVEYRLGGSCDAFWQQLGGSCDVITRSEWQASLTAPG